MRFLGVDPDSEHGSSPTIWEDGDSYVIQGWRIADPGTLAEVGDVAGADNPVRAGHAACSYSWRMPLRRSRLRTVRCVILFEAVIGTGSGCSGLAFEMPR
jgi:hypothetical protein